MAEQYATHLSLHNDPLSYRILAFIGPDERHAPNWLIAKTSYEHLRFYKDLHWVVLDQIEAMKIEPDMPDMIVQEEDGA